MRSAAIAFSIALMLATGAGAQALPPKLTALHEALHLSGDQEAAWRDYVAAISPRPDQQARRDAADQLIPLVPTPRRIALMQAAMDQDNADFRRQGAGVITFYGRLSLAQQQIFDRETAPSFAGGAPTGEAGPDR
jgi:protein CpxP